MCGICGVYDFGNNPHIDETILKKMSQVLTHRGPDDEGIFLDNGIGLAVKRLSVIDVEGGHQPIHNEDESIWIIFNGEIYNYEKLRQLLERLNHRFYTLSDTEVIVHSYEEFGDDCVKKFNGMFAFAIWDENEKKLLLARDRMGIKPLHYIVLGDKLIFGSEIKSMLQDPSILREVDTISLHHFLGYEYVPAPRTIFKGIKKLLPGYMLTCKKGNILIKKYWDVIFSNYREEKISYYVTQINRILKKSVQRRLVSDVPLGAILSGGIDSSSIVGFMTNLMDRPVKTFSIGFDDQSYNELKYARLVAEYFNTEHHEKIIEPNMVNLAKEIIHFFDEPFADVSIFPTYLVYSFASNQVTVVLSGDGGDELFAGYDWYIASWLDGYYRRLPLIFRKEVENIFEKIPPSPAKKDSINILKRFVEGSSLSSEGRHVRWQFFLTDTERKELYSNILKKLYNLNSFDLINSYYLRKNARDRLSREQYVDLKTYLPDDILTKIDRMSMANSIEARVPFLDHIFVEFSATIPHNLKLRGLTSKYILKNAMSSFLPKQIIRRKKQGFSIPIKNWLKCELKDLMLNVLSKEKIKETGYFNYDYVNKITQQHLKGEKNNAHQIWALVTFQLWHEMYID